MRQEYGNDAFSECPINIPSVHADFAKLESSDPDSLGGL